MPHALHRRRTRRLAACTALALGLGLLSVVPTSSTAVAASTTAGAKPRFDRDGDGTSDRVYRSAATGELRISLSKTGTSAPFALSSPGMEILPADDLTGTSTPELLTLQADGSLVLRRGVSPTSVDAGADWTGHGWQIYNKVLAPGDLTADGHQDLLARTPDGTLYLYAGKGTIDNGGPFRTRAKVGGGWQVYDQLVGTNDLDGDAIADMVARTTGGDLYFYQGTGSPTAPFKARVLIGGGWYTYNQIIGADDLDGDGRADLLARSYSGAFYRYLSVGGGKFGAPTAFGGGGQTLSYYLGQGGVPAYGKHNLFTVNAAGTAFTHGALADGKLTAPRQYAGAGDFAYHWPTVNGYALDGVDRANLLTADNRGLMMWREEGGTPIGNQVGSGTAYQNYQFKVSPGDVNGDGEADFIGADHRGDLYLHPGLKSHSPAYLGPAVRIGSIGTSNMLIGAGDVTGDGRPDLVSRDGEVLYVHAGTGSATAPFAPRNYVGHGWYLYKYLASPGDMDGDGRADLVAVTPGGDVYRYSSSGLVNSYEFHSRVKIASGWKYDHVS
ncbi:FG-GAP repeat domain-containing protein [Streptomyces sp. NPDC055912]|uniref:FG-GAP repeat domain-containing protein n=1 Tax=Streptomyces sp. NPDC055912 TaxID=3345660 RepID=UPI0035D66C8F